MSAPASERVAGPAEDGTAGRAGPSRALTRTFGESLRRGRTWLVLAVVLVVAAIVLFVLQGGRPGAGEPLGADDASPDGAKALVQVLREHGVDVVEATGLDDALGAVGSGATLLVHDPDFFLSERDRDRILDRSLDLVVVEPAMGALADWAPGVRLGGVGEDAEGPGCEFAPAVRAEGLPGGLATVVVGEDAADAGWSACFADADGRAALATRQSEEGRRTIVADPALLANGTIDREGSAALVIGVLGGRERLVWYRPGIADADGAAAPEPGELAPGWVSPVLVLLALTAVVAGVAAGRRFGPLVVEPLPVEVPAAETSHGRARLYERAGVRTHALDLLRLGAIERIGRMLRLGREADVADVVGAAAAATGRPPGPVHDLLVGLEPTGDAELARLARELQDLEDHVAGAVRDGAPQPPNASAAPGAPTASERPDQEPS